MTDRYHLDVDDAATEERPGDRETASDDDAGRPTGAVDDTDRPTGVSIPRAHVGAFVAETFEDPERDTAWTDVVGALVADDARDAWEELAPRAQVEELLAMADDYDDRATDLLDDVPIRGSDGGEPVRDRFDEALRRRRNADIIRDGIAHAYASGRIDDATLVAAVESFGFDTERIAAREDRLETVANAYGFDFRPYGGTLFSETVDAGRGGETTWEVDP